jgi:hypothetical protein
MKRRWALAALAVGLLLAAWPAAFLGRLIPDNLVDKRPIEIAASAILLIFGVGILGLLLRDRIDPPKA